MIADGNGNEPKPFKAEWAVIKARSQCEKCLFKDAKDSSEFAPFLHILKVFQDLASAQQDDHVWLGSIGFEWYGKSGEILHRNAEWARDLAETQRGEGPWGHGGHALR